MAYVRKTEGEWTPARRAAHCQQVGGKGGSRTVEIYGKGFMREIGKIGFQSTADRHHDGNRAKTLAALKLITSPNRNVRQPGMYQG
ncbi:MAG: hypothetical protein ACR2M1_10455 [Gemmatimonadaceae bacterium]